MIRTTCKALLRRRFSTSSGNVPLTSFLIKGFMKYSSKDDLTAYLRKVNINVTRAVAILDFRHTPTGQWLLTMDAPSIAVYDKGAIAAASIYNKTRQTSNRAGAAASAPAVPLLLPRTATPITLLDGIQLRKIQDTEPQRLLLTSVLGITPCTICVHTVPPYFTIDHVRHVFDGYDIDEDQKSIRPWAPRRPTQPVSSYLVNFRTPEEAERACREKSGSIHDGAVMRITWYNV